MPSMIEVARDRTSLSGEDRAWLARLLADWQTLADLSFSDLVLWLPAPDAAGFWAAAHIRPSTGPTSIIDDVVDSYVEATEHPRLHNAFAAGRMSRDGDPEWRNDIPVRVEAFPVRRAGSVIGVIARNTNLQGVRAHSRLELAYLDTAAELSQMIADGDFPRGEELGDHADAPRVGDGFIRVDAGGIVTYASPNALSVYRKLGLAGDLEGQPLAELTRTLVPHGRRQDEETLSAVLGGRSTRDTEIDNGNATVAIRAIPLTARRSHRGAMVLLRDVTQLRRRERELVTKDATIREIHHRVKNNLQTVAALLRLQSRRMESGPGRLALDEAVRRVGAIALVHEVLSQTHEERVEFDQIADQLARLVVDVGAHDASITINRRGSFGALSSDVASSVAMVLTELLQNAVEHAFAPGEPGRVEITCRRSSAVLTVGVGDDGVGWPDDIDQRQGDSLGLSIVRTLVGELGGELRLGGDIGALASFAVPVGE